MYFSLNFSVSQNVFACRIVNRIILYLYELNHIIVHLNNSLRINNYNFDSGIFFCLVIFFTVIEIRMNQGVLNS